MVNSRKQGFTIVELLIVVVVIAILAAITIVSYNGIVRQALIVTMKSDLRTNSTILEETIVRDGTYPSSPSTAGVKTGTGNLVLATLQRGVPRHR